MHIGTKIAALIAALMGRLPLWGAVLTDVGTLVLVCLVGVIPLGFTGFDSNDTDTGPGAIDTTGNTDADTGTVGVLSLNVIGIGIGIEIKTSDDGSGSYSPVAIADADAAEKGKGKAL